jgi:hypothetical protein
VIDVGLRIIRSRCHSAPPLLSIFLLISLGCVLGTAAAKDDEFRPLRMPDGHVDMQGTWKNSNLTPLQRPDQFKTLAMTSEEAANFKAQYIDAMSGQKMPDDPGGLLEDRQIEPIRGELRSSVIIDPQDGKIPFKEIYKERSASIRANVLLTFDGPEQRPNLERCLSSTNAPPMQPTADNNYYQIVQTPHNLVIVSELIHDARIVRINATHAPAAITSWLGDSIGWWEQDTLVVETRNFSANSLTRMSGRMVTFVSPQTTIVERFTRDSNDEINYVFTVEDPTYYTRPWTGETHLLRTNNQMFEFSCHEGNYSLRYMLEAARLKDTN